MLELYCRSIVEIFVSPSMHYENLTFHFVWSRIHFIRQNTTKAITIYYIFLTIGRISLFNIYGNKFSNCVTWNEYNCVSWLPAIPLIVKYLIAAISFWCSWLAILLYCVYYCFLVIKGSRPSLTTILV